MKKKTKEAIKEIVWMARRYADGRRTYAPQMFNDAYDELVKVLGKGFDDDVPNEKSVIKSFPYAREGKVY